jgi:uncharacterized BrkB/YihY/UPF0761 family membrane protein
MLYFKSFLFALAATVGFVLVSVMIVLTIAIVRSGEGTTVGWDPTSIWHVLAWLSSAILIAVFTSAFFWRYRKERRTHSDYE